MVVLPAEPVMPAIIRSGSRSTSAQASLASAAGTSATIRAGTPTGLVARTTVAPAAIACAAKSCPSARSPGSAANRPPGETWRESMTAGPVTTIAGSAT